MTAPPQEPPVTAVNGGFQAAYEPRSRAGLKAVNRSSGLSVFAPLRGQPDYRQTGQQHGVGFRLRHRGYIEIVQCRITVLGAVFDPTEM